MTEDRTWSYLKAKTGRSNALSPVTHARVSLIWNNYPLSLDIQIHKSAVPDWTRLAHHLHPLCLRRRCSATFALFFSADRVVAAGDAKQEEARVERRRCACQ